MEETPVLFPLDLTSEEELKWSLIWEDLKGDDEGNGRGLEAFEGTGDIKGLPREGSVSPEEDI